MRALLILPLTFITLAIFPANAQESAFCGAPKEASLDTKAEGHCDLFQRQFAYRDESLKLNELMKERQENFAAPRRAALEQYEEGLKDLNATRGSQ